MCLKLDGLDTLLFDFGGTLDAPGVHWLTRFQSLYRDVGAAVPPERVHAAFYWADTQILRHPALATLTFLPLLQAHVALQLRYLGLPCQPYQQPLAEGFWRLAGASLQASVQVLTMLQSKYTLGIISNFYGNVAILCQECG